MTKDWYFTFGADERNYGNRYVKIHGTFQDAREEMHRRHADHWAFQYHWEEFKSQIARYQLKEFK